MYAKEQLLIAGYSGFRGYGDLFSPGSFIMKTPACRTSRESMGYKTPQTTDLNPVTLTYGIDLCDLDPRNLDLGPPFLKLR